MTPPVIISIVAAVISLVGLAIATSNFFIAQYRHVETTLQDYLRFLISGDLAEARAVIGTAARTQEGEQQVTTEAVRDAAFRLMWAVQVAQPLIQRKVKGTRAGSWEARAIYQQLNIIIEDLSMALTTWGHRFDWKKTGKAVNTLLDKMPAAKDEWERDLAHITPIRLPSES